MWSFEDCEKRGSDAVDWEELALAAERVDGDFEFYL